MLSITNNNNIKNSFGPLLSEKGTPKGKYKNRKMQNAKIEKSKK